MSTSNVPVPRGAVNAIADIVKSVFAFVCPSAVKRHARLAGEASGIFEVAKQNVIENALRNGVIALPPGTTLEMVNQASMDELSIAVGKTEKRNGVFEKFASYFNDEEIKKLPPIREEIASKVFEYAGDCATKEAQERWAKLMAGECRSPGSISLNTVHLLRRMSTEDAEMLESFAHCTANAVIFLRDTEGDNLERIIHLANMGLITDLSYGSRKSIQPNERVAISKWQYKWVLRNTTNKVLVAKGYLLTRSGVEIMNLSETMPDIEKIVARISNNSGDVEWEACPEESE